MKLTLMNVTSLTRLKKLLSIQENHLHLWKEKNDMEKIGNSLRFLSRLWWFDGNRKNAENFAEQAIEVLNNQPSSSAKAMALQQYVAIENAYRSI